MGSARCTLPLTELRPSRLDEEELLALVEHVGTHASEALPEFGDPAKAICDAAEECDVDVVVVGSHDKGVLRRLIDPSVAQAVVCGTDRPVLVVSGPVE